MATTGAVFATGTPATTQTNGSWSTPANASGANNATVSTWTSTGSGASATIRPSGYGLQALIGSAPQSVDQVIVRAYTYVSNTSRVTGRTIQLHDGTSVIGSSQAITGSTSTTNVQQFTFTGVIWAQLANLGALLTFTRAAVTTAGTASVDAVSIEVVYTPVPTPPATPSAPTLVSKTSTSVDTQWAAVSGATSYTLKRGTTTVYTGANLTFSDTGLTPSTAYSYTVIASNTAGDSAASSALNVTTDAPPAEVKLVNSFMGIASGTGVTSGNSGGTSGDAFTGVDITASGGTATVDTAADITDAYDRGVFFNPNGQANSSVNVYWDVTAISTSYHRMYFYSPATAPNAISRLAIGSTAGGAARVWELRLLTDRRVALVDATSGNTILQTTSPLAASTIYRIEWKVALTEAACDMKVHVGEDTTTPMTLTRFGNNITGSNLSWVRVRYGITTGSTAYNQPVQLAAVGFSDTNWIGPALAGFPTAAFTVMHGGVEKAVTFTVWHNGVEKPVTFSVGG
jgi:hypothetical protein